MAELTWTELRPKGDGEYPWFGQSMSDSGAVIAMLANVAYPVVGEVWLSRNSGASWAKQTPNGDVQYNSVAVSGDGSAVVIGENSGRVWLSVSGGAYSEIQPVGDSDEYWASIATDDDGSCIFAANEFRLWLSTNGGSSFSEVQPLGDTNQQWLGVQVRNGGSILLAANAYSTPKLYLSVDGGDNWEAVGDGYQFEFRYVGSNMATIGCSADGAIILCGEDSFADFDYSFDSGETFDYMAAAGDGSKSAAGVTLDGSTIFAAEYDGRLWRSDDDGETWTEEQPVGDSDQYWGDITCGTTAVLVSTCKTTATTAGRIYLAGVPPKYTDDIFVPATPAEELASLLSPITASHIECDFGVEVLDENGTVLQDIAADCISGEVERNCYATIHGTCRLQFARELQWGTNRVRPYVTLTGDGFTRTWYMGVYLPLTPDRQMGETPTMWDVQGYDLLQLLNVPIGDAYTVAATTGYLEAVRTAIAASGATGVTTLLDTTAESKTLTKAMAWVLDSEETTYLRVVNDLLKAVGYRGLWADSLGRYRSEPYVSPATRSPIWTFDLADLPTQIVAGPRRMVTDEYDATNYWVFIQNGTSALPVTDTGLYVIDNSGDDREIRRVVSLDVEGQTELEARGDEIVETAARRKRAIDITCSPLPLLEHFDVVVYDDGETGFGSLKCQVVSYRAPLDGSDYSLALEVVE